MRILIDLQSCQAQVCQLQETFGDNSAENECLSIARQSLSLILVIAQNAPSHQIWILLNDKFTESVPALRQLLSPFIPKDRVVAFSTPQNISTRSLKKPVFTEANRLIRELFIATLRPDIVYKIEALLPATGLIAEAQNEVAKQVIKTFETTGRRKKASSIEDLYNQFILDLSCELKRYRVTENELATLSVCIATNLGMRQPQLIVDISQLVIYDAKSGIQRVVRSILYQLLQPSATLYKVIPVYWDGLCYRHARRFVDTILSEKTITTEKTTDDVVDIACNDVFLGLDLSPHLAPNTRKTLLQFRNRGVKIYFVVYDILLIIHPEWWPKDLSTTFLRWLEIVSELSTGLVCISKATAADVKAWLLHFPPQRNDCIEISSFRLGSDIDKSLPSQGLPQNAVAIIEKLQRAPSFLIVGTIEPRKGHRQALQAFELLWQAGLNFNLVFVGNSGWQVESLVEQINAHPERNRQLFWLQDVSDEYLVQVYAASTALLFPSNGEGFGLPIIEAAQHQLPIIARDLPIFREVANDHAFYFEGNQPEQLVAAIKAWLTLYKEGKAPASEEMSSLTWADSTAQLLNIILP